MFRRIKATLKLSTSSALTKVILSSTSTHIHPANGTRVEMQQENIIDTKRALEEAIIGRNKRHFAQAQGTPFSVPPLSHISSNNGFNVYRDHAGNDITLSDSSFIETNTVLDILREKASTPTQSWSPLLTFDDFISGLLHWQESTSTSPSGCHLGVYKALVTAYLNNSDEFSLPDMAQETNNDLLPDITNPGVATGTIQPIWSTQEKAERILQLIHGLLATAARHGFYLARWTQVVNVMIYKRPGCIDLEKLRVIHLFEADFNLAIGIYFGRRAMQHQVRHQLIHDGQFGKPHGECQDAALSKVLYNMVAQFSQTPLGQFESDATACFDREVMNFVLTCFRLTGAPMGPL